MATLNVGKVVTSINDVTKTIRYLCHFVNISVKVWLNSFNKDEFSKEWGMGESFIGFSDESLKNFILH